MDVVLNEEDSYIIYLYFFSPVYCEPDWDGCGPQWGRLIYYISVFFFSPVYCEPDWDGCGPQWGRLIYYISVFFFSSLLRTRLRWMWSSMRKTHILYICIFFPPVYCEPDWDGCGPQWGRLIYYISVFFFLQFIANQTEMDVVLNEEDSYIIYLYSFFSSLLQTRLRWMWSSMRKTHILYICIFFSPVYCEPDWDGCGPQWGRLIYYISVFFFLQFIANQTEMDVVLNEEDSYIIYLYFFFSSLLLTRLRWMWSSMRKTHILYICIFFSPVYC